ncbi:MAG: response regulator transcription factor [Idiomarina sp.]|nr:response regulator transcription factor [Idiomarina sp.]
MAIVIAQSFSQGGGNVVRIAYLEDDSDQAALVMHWLEAGGHACNLAADGASMLQLLEGAAFDLVLLDWEVPDIDGLTVLTRFRQRDALTPVLFTTLRDDESSVVSALNAGADDYMIKPITETELLARINALSRRAGLVRAAQQAPVDIGPWSIDGANHRILMAGKTVALTGKDYELAAYLLCNEGVLMSREHLLEKIWGIRNTIESRTVDVHISRIRRSLSITPENGYRIKSIYQHGYRLEAV